MKPSLATLRKLFSRSSGRRKRFGLPIKIVGLILVTVFIPSLLISALGLYAVYRAEPLVREQVEAPIRRRLSRLLRNVSEEWKRRHARYEERLQIESDLHRYLASLPKEDPYILGALIVRSDGVVEPLRLESPLWHLAPPRPGSELSAAWRAEFVDGDPAGAGRMYRRLAAGAAPEIAVEALLGLARVEAGRQRPREAILHLKRLVDRFGYTVDDAGIPRGLAALLRITELYRDVGDLVNEAVHRGKTRTFLREVEPWLEPETAEFFWARLDDLAARSGRPADDAGEESVAGDPEPPKNSLAGGPIVDRAIAHSRGLDPDETFGYLTVPGQAGDGGFHEDVNLAYFRPRTREHTVYLALNPRAYLRDVRRFCGPFEVASKRIRFVDAGGQFVLDHESPAGRAPISVRLPRPFGDSYSMDYYPARREIPAPLERLETLETAAFAWGIVVLGLTVLLGILVTVRSILEEMRLARLKSDFVSFVTHELKTPLAGIRTLTETLLMGRGGDRADERRCIRMIDKEATRLSRFIGSVLEFSRLEKYQHNFAFTSCDMAEVVEEAVRLFKEHSPRHDYEIEIHRAQHISRIRMDRAAILEAVLNLVSNAYKYSRGSPKKIVINLRESIDHISVDVIDNGVGIAKRDQRKIFERFYRAEDYLTRDVEGSGLGLSFARYIAKIHDGDIRVQSAPGQGSTFTLELRKNQVLAE